MTAVHSLCVPLLLAAAIALPAAPAPSTKNTPAANSAPLAASVPAAPGTDEERVQVYRDFRKLFDTHTYGEALPLAEKLVTMTEGATSPDDLALATPLVNLATTHYQLGTYDAAEAAYLRAIQIIEQRTGGFTKSLVGPLRGLGLTYLGAGQPQAAIAPLRRAVDITRKIDGLFSFAQLEVLDPLIRAYGQVDKLDDAEREQIYSYRVNENHYGKASIDVVPALEQLAHWYTEAGRYTAARQYYAGALNIVQRVAGQSDPRLIPALRGLAETHRLEFIYGPEQADDGNAAASNAPGGSLVNAGAPTTTQPATGGTKLNPNGEDALRTALKIAETAPNNDPAVRAALLIDIGDWLLIGGGNDSKEAINSYRRALPMLTTLPPPQNSALSQPAQIFYRPPITANRSHRAKPEHVIEGFVDVEFTVTGDGHVVNAHTAGKSANESQEHAVTMAIKKARYRPRFENGEPVQTEGVRVHQVVFAYK
jgi:tetratricopeptide (TPR) repeat protein